METRYLTGYMIYGHGYPVGVGQQITISDQHLQVRSINWSNIYKKTVYLHCICTIFPTWEVELELNSWRVEAGQRTRSPESETRCAAGQAEAAGVRPGDCSPASLKQND